MILKGLVRRLEELEIGGQAKTLKLYHKISQNTENSLGDPRELAFIQPPVKNNQPTVLWRTQKEYNNNDNNPGDLLSLRIQWNTTRLFWCDELTRSKIIIKLNIIYLMYILFYLRRGIILQIELLWCEYPANTRKTCFNIIRSHQQCILWSRPMEIEPAITRCRAETLPLSQQAIYFLVLEVIIVMWMRISNPLGKTWTWRWPCPLLRVRMQLTRHIQVNWLRNYLD